MLNHTSIQEWAKENRDRIDSAKAKTSKNMQTKHQVVLEKGLKTAADKQTVLDKKMEKTVKAANAAGKKRILESIIGLENEHKARKIALELSLIENKNNAINDCRKTILVAQHDIDMMINNLAYYVAVCKENGDFSKNEPMLDNERDADDDDN